jgi:hypothetical protein
MFLCEIAKMSYRSAAHPNRGGLLAFTGFAMEQTAVLPANRFKVRPLQLQIRVKYLNISAGQSVDGFGGRFHIAANCTGIAAADSRQMVLLNGMQMDEPQEKKLIRFGLAQGIF